MIRVYRRSLLVLLVLLFFSTSAFAYATITLAWDYQDGTTVTGFHVYRRACAFPTWGTTVQILLPAKQFTVLVPEGIPLCFKVDAFDVPADFGLSTPVLSVTCANHQCVWQIGDIIHTKPY